MLRPTGGIDVLAGNVAHIDDTCSGRQEVLMCWQADVRKQILLFGMGLLIETSNEWQCNHLKQAGDATNPVVVW